MIGRLGLRALAAAAGLLLAAATSAAQSVHEVVAGGDAVAGTVDDAADVDRVPVRLPEGALFTLTVKAAKGSTLLPAVTLLDPDRVPDAAAGPLWKANPKGNVLALKNLPVTRTGLRWIEIRGKDGTTGGWTLSTKVKLPKGATGTAQVKVADGPKDIAFAAPGNATASLKVGPAKGSAATPEFVALYSTTGAAMLLDEVVPSATGFTIPTVLLPLPGTYVLRVDTGAGEGDVVLTAKWKIPKPLKRLLAETQIITDPVAVSISPTGAETSQQVPVTLAASFLLPGAKAIFRKTPTVVTIQGSGVTVGETGMSFTLTLASFQKGVYDVEVENPDGGRSVLPKAFTVSNAAAIPSSVLPASGYDNQVVDITISGAWFQTGATVDLVLGAETIPGTAVSVTSSSIRCTVDLRNRTTGSWDVVIGNPDAADGVLAAAFTILNAPPVALSITPKSNLNGASVNFTVTGTDFDPVPTVLLRRAGKADIPATGVLRPSGTTITGTFDTTGASVGSWSVVVTNPDLASSTLANGFSVLGSVAPPAQAIVLSRDADAPPAVVYNATRNEFLVAWVEDTSGNGDVYAQRVSASGAALGTVVTVATTGGGIARRDVAVGWNPTGDEYLVGWSEARTNTSGAVRLLVVVQRLAGADIAALGANVLVTDNTLFSGWAMDAYNNFRATICWNPSAGLWLVGWTQEWALSSDDWDVLYRSFNPSATPALGTITGVAFSSIHESELQLLWDSVNNQLVHAYRFRSSISASGVIRLNGTTVATDASASLSDPRLALDAATGTGRILLTWTQTGSTGNSAVQGAIFSATSTSVPIGSTTTFSSGSDDFVQCRPAWNAALGQAAVVFTRKEAVGGGLSVRFRRVDTTDSSGPVLLGSELEASGGNGDEAGGTVLYASASGETVVFWTAGATFATVTGIAGSIPAGVWRGPEIWMARLQ